MEECDMIDVNVLMDQCYHMKIKALEMAYGTGINGSHIGGAFSAMEILSAVYAVANISDMKSCERDRIILSKGHAVLAYYTILWQKGLVTEEELAAFDKNGTLFHGHPSRIIDKGMEFASGSLGLGLSYAVGVAWACQQRGLKNRIYAIIGDGECDEGIVWESLMSISHFGLKNITIIVDRNNYQVDGPTSEVMNTSELTTKFEAFGLPVKKVDGHDLNALIQCLQDITGSSVIIADTVKAHGISFLENTNLSHHCTLNNKKYEQALLDIQKAYGKC